MSEPDRSPPPDYSRLAFNDDWVSLWQSPNSAIYREIERLELRLHDTRPTTLEEVTAIKNRLDAFKWLRDTVSALAQPPEPAKPKRRFGHLFTRVLNPTLG